jgi:hypothetical protein
MIIIGLMGAKGSGKTTAFNFIKERLPYVGEITLAAKLKNVCSEVFEIPREYFDSHKYKEQYLQTPVYLDQKKLQIIYKDFLIDYPNYDTDIRPHVGVILDTPRKIAQYVGTEVLRKTVGTVHCINAFKTFLDSNAAVGVVTDIRFPNELTFFKAKAEVFIPIFIKNTAAEIAASKDSHESESYLSNLAAASICVPNETTLENFKTLLYTKLVEMGVL